MKEQCCYVSLDPANEVAEPVLPIFICSIIYYNVLRSLFSVDGIRATFFWTVFRHVIDNSNTRIVGNIAWNSVHAAVVFSTTE